MKRSILNSLARQAAASTPPSTLLGVLSAYQDALVSGIQGGRLVEMHTGAGKATKFRTPLLGEHFRQEDIGEFSQELLEVYADSVTALGLRSIPSPTDAQILAQMLLDDRLQSVTSTRVSYLLVNYPNRF